MTSPPEFLKWSRGNTAVSPYIYAIGTDTRFYYGYRQTTSPSDPVQFPGWTPTMGGLTARSVLYDTVNRPNGEGYVYVVGTDGNLYKTPYGFIHDFNQFNFGTKHPIYINISDIAWNRDGKLLIVSTNGFIYATPSSAIDWTTSATVNRWTARTTVDNAILQSYRLSYDPTNDKFFLITTDHMIHLESSAPDGNGNWLFAPWPNGTNAESITFDPADGRMLGVSTNHMVYKATTTNLASVSFVQMGSSGNINFLFFPEPFTPACSISNTTAYTVQTNTDYPGNDLAQSQVTQDMCCDQCEADPLCIGYITSPDGQCWLKENLGQSGLVLGQSLGTRQANQQRTSYIKTSPYNQVFAMLFSSVNFTNPSRYMLGFGPYVAAVGNAQSVVLGTAQMVIKTISGNVTINGPTSISNLPLYIQGALPPNVATTITEIDLFPIPPHTTPTAGKYPCTWNADGQPLEWCTNSSWPFILENKPDVTIGSTYLIPGSCVACGPAGAGAMQCPTNNEWSQPASGNGCATCSFAPSQWNVPGGVVGTQLGCSRTAYLADHSQCCRLNNDPSATATVKTTETTSGTELTCDPIYRGPGTAGCAPIMESECTIDAMEADATLWAQCKHFVDQNNDNSPGLVHSMVASYFGKYSPSDRTTHTDDLLAMAKTYIGSTDNVLSTACSTVTHEQIMRNSAGLSQDAWHTQQKWCGCHMPSNQYASEQYISPQVVPCDAACRIADVVPQAQCTTSGTGATATSACTAAVCTTSQCIMQDVTVDLTESNVGPITISQNCGTCPGNGCECYFGDVKVTGSGSKIGTIDFSQNCQTCYQIGTDGVPTKVQCSDVCPVPGQCGSTPTPGPQCQNPPCHDITPGQYSTISQAYTNGGPEAVWQFMGTAKVAGGRVSLQVVYISVIVLAMVLSIGLGFVSIPIAGIVFIMTIVAIFGSLYLLRNKPLVVPSN